MTRESIWNELKFCLKEYLYVYICVGICGRTLSMFACMRARVCVVSHCSVLQFMRCMAIYDVIMLFRYPGHMLHGDTDAFLGKLCEKKYFNGCVDNVSNVEYEYLHKNQNLFHII